MTIRHRLLAFSMLLGLLVHSGAAYAATGTEYQNTDDSTGQTNFTHSSGSMSIDGTLESITGQATGTGFGVELGSQTNPGGSTAATVQPPQYGSMMPGPITLDGQSCGIAYSNLVSLTGTKTSDIIYMFVNNELAGFYFPDPFHWYRNIWLREAANAYVIVGKTERGIQSNIINLSLALRNMGDVNNDTFTNEYDLSLLLNAWEKRYDCSTDLNRDNITDEYDLSLLISNWNG